MRRKVAKSSTAAGGLLADCGGLAGWLADLVDWRTLPGGLGGLADLADSALADLRTRAWRTLADCGKALADSGGLRAGSGGLWRTWRTRIGSWLSWPIKAITGGLG